jgi:hypothetical protein
VTGNQRVTVEKSDSPLNSFNSHAVTVENTKSGKRAENETLPSSDSGDTQFREQLILLREENAKAYSNPTPWTRK